MGEERFRKGTLRLLLGDQLNSKHSWFNEVDPGVCYVMMETRSETDYVVHHIQKTVGFFLCMREFATSLKELGHSVVYLRLDDTKNLQSIEKNISYLVNQFEFTRFEYQLPDEYRLDEVLRQLCLSLSITSAYIDTEHFLTRREELGAFFEGKKSFLMESFYRYMRKKHGVLMDCDQPLHGQWNFDSDNRNKLPKNTKGPTPFLFDTNVEEIHEEIRNAGVSSMGSIDPKHFLWPKNRSQALELLDFFATQCLELFGTFQDAMAIGEWSLYHSRISFSMNLKLISPSEVINRVIEEYHKRPKEISYNQLEGFVRQIIGWREYMRGVYWNQMPGYARLNYFGHEGKLPSWYWDGKTKMNCLRQCISQSLNFAYAHHIQRLMITGNFALLIGANPDEVDGWYLGIYIDAIEWVEITNTRGMSQFADGGLLATKPYVSSAAYIHKMSNYCTGCFYKKDLRTGAGACPFNSLYWHFIARNETLLAKNPRMSMMYSTWYKFSSEDRQSTLNQAENYLARVDEL